jgi:type IV secretory pathway TrbL component
MLKVDVKLDKEEMKRLINEVIQEREEERSATSNYAFYRFYIFFSPIIIIFGLILYILVVNDVQFSSQFLKDILLKRVAFIGSILFMSVGFLGVFLALWIKPKNLL